MNRKLNALHTLSLAQIAVWDAEHNVSIAAAAMRNTSTVREASITRMSYDEARDALKAANFVELAAELDLARAS